MEEHNNLIVRTKLANGSILIQAFPDMDATVLANTTQVKALVTAYRKVIDGTALDYYVVNSKKYSDA